VEDSWQSAADIAALYTNPTWWVERYMNNNWNYKDEDQTIFKSHLFAKAKVSSYKGGRQTIGYDVAEDGKDRSVMAVWDNLTLIDIVITNESDQQKKTEIQAQELIEYSNDHSVGYENVAVDGVGIGVGVLASARLLGVEFGVYKSGYAADPKLTFEEHAPSDLDVEGTKDMISYDMLRSQVAYMFAMGMEQGKIKVLETCPHLEALIEEAQTHHHDVSSKVFKLESKKAIKLRSGKSPDIFDAVVMGLWAQMKKGKKVELGFF